MFHSLLLTEIFRKNGYPENFSDRIHILKEKFPTVKKKLLRLVLPYLRIISP